MPSRNVRLLAIVSTLAVVGARRDDLEHRLALHTESVDRKDWRQLWCNQNQVKTDCEKVADDKVKKCAEWHKKYQAATGAVAKNKLYFDDGGCRKFFDEKQSCIEQANEPEPPHRLKDAVPACEKSIHTVCVESVCPTYKVLKDLTEGDCEAWCKESEGTMFHTGEIKCTEDESGAVNWAKCMQDWAEEKGDRRLEMEALMREHLLKCVCVTARDDTSICYNDEDNVGLGIPHGKMWCDFYDTPSWRKLLNEKRASDPAKLPVDQTWVKAPVCKKDELGREKKGTDVKDKDGPSAKSGVQHTKAVGVISALAIAMSLFSS